MALFLKETIYLLGCNLNMAPFCPGRISVVHSQTQSHLFRVGVCFSCLSHQHLQSGADQKLDPPARNSSQSSLRTGNPLHSRDSVKWVHYSRDNVKWGPRVLLKTSHWSYMSDGALDWPTDSKAEVLAWRQLLQKIGKQIFTYCHSQCPI